MLEVDVAHVDAQTRCLRVLLVLQDDGVTVDSLSVQAVGMVHVRQVVEHVESQVDVHLVKTSCLLSERTDLFLLCGGFFCLLESVIVVFGNLGCCRLLK